MSQEVDKLRESHTKMEKAITALWDKCADLEDQSRRDNVWNCNVPEHEEGDDLVDYCKAIFQSMLKDYPKPDIPIIEVHWVGLPHNSPVACPRAGIVPPQGCYYEGGQVDGQAYLLIPSG
ncbi:hypothetical protein NDU88_005055 [Pleurodeles waltl]|uniref:Uncharacterized protein n=1 Tax=Pleurodeles waltl TaxID=8319 RepID=A0AAV7LJX2_PLEWA|nr:hypothetical protein NDU88_005055 [Pleurodeles waltl]